MQMGQGENDILVFRYAIIGFATVVYAVHENERN